MHVAVHYYFFVTLFFFFRYNLTTKFSFIWFSCLFFLFLFTDILLYNCLKCHLTKAKTTKYQLYCHHIPLRSRLIVLIKPSGIRGFFLNCKMNFNLSWRVRCMIFRKKRLNLIFRNKRHTLFKLVHLFSSEI